MKYLFYLIFPLLIFSQDPSFHEPWELEGASERIEKYRKTNTILNFNFPTDIKKKNGKLKIKLINHDFKFGVGFTQLRKMRGNMFDLYLERFNEVFNYATVGMYWVLTDERSGRKQIDKYYDDIIKWSIKNNVRLKGHPLMWHEGMPDWVRYSKDLDQLEVAMKTHMRRLIETYPEINDWDVYNEPVGPFKPHIPYSAIQDWINHKGGIYPAMVEIYQYVNSVNPEKNYSNNHYHAKDPEYFKINEYYVQKNLNFSSIGMQAHMQSNDNVMTESQVWDQIEDYAVLGKNIQFTEITVTSSKRFNNWKDHQEFLAKRDESLRNGKEMDLPSLPEYEDFQASYLKDFYTLVFSHPSVSSITFWNLTDKNAWRGHAGGLLYKDLSPKKSFLTLKQLIKETWTTEISEKINISDSFEFRGFFGDYEGEIQVDKKLYKFSFSIDKETDGPIDLVLK